MAWLLAEGLAPATPAALIASGTRPDQRTVLGTVATIAAAAAQAAIRPPAITLVGEVAALHDRLSWFEWGYAASGVAGWALPGPEHRPVAWQPGWRAGVRTSWRRRRSRSRSCPSGADLGAYEYRLPDVRQRARAAARR